MLAAQMDHRPDDLWTQRIMMHSDQRIGGSPGSPFSSLLTRVQTSINELRQEVAAARQESVVTADHVRKGVCPPHAVAKRAAPAAPPGHLAHALKSPTHTPDLISCSMAASADAAAPMSSSLELRLQALEQHMADEGRSMQRQLAAFASSHAGSSAALQRLTGRLDTIELSHVEVQSGLRNQAGRLSALDGTVQDAVEELGKQRGLLQQQGELLQRHDERMGQQGERLQQQGGRLQQQGERLQQQGERLQQQGERLEQQGERLEQHGEQLEQHGEQLKQHAVAAAVLAAHNGSNAASGTSDVQYSEEVAALRSQVIELSEQLMVQKAMLSGQVQAMSQRLQELEEQQQGLAAAGTVPSSPSPLLEQLQSPQDVEALSALQSTVKQLVTRFESMDGGDVDAAELAVASDALAAGAASSALQARMDSFETNLQAAVMRFAPSNQPAASSPASLALPQQEVLEMHSKLDDLASAVQRLQGGAMAPVDWEVAVKASADKVGDLEEAVAGLQAQVDAVQQQSSEGLTDARAALSDMQHRLEEAHEASGAGARCASAVKQLGSMLDACEKLAQSVEQAQQCTSVQAQLPDSAAGVPLPQQLLLLAGRVDACEEGVKAALVSAEAGGAAAADSQLAATHAMCEAHAVALHHLQSEMTALQLAAAAAAAAAAVAAGHSGSEGALSQQVSGLAGEVEALAQRLAALDERLESANESAHSASEQADSRMSSLAQEMAELQRHAGESAERAAATTGSHDETLQELQAGVDRLTAELVASKTEAAGTVDAVLSDVRGQVDAAHQLLFELRVEMQNEVCQLGERITSVADAQSDVGILADSCKATVQRTEGQVADMADKVEELAAAVQLVQGGGNPAESMQQSEASRVLQDHVEDLQQQSQQLSDRMQHMQQQLDAAPDGAALAQVAQQAAQLQQLTGAAQATAEECKQQLQQLAPRMDGAAEASLQAADQAGAALQQVLDLRAHVGESLTYLGEQVGQLEAQLVLKQHAYPAVLNSVDSSPCRSPPFGPQAIYNTLFDHECGSSEAGDSGATGPLLPAQLLGDMTPLSVYSNAAFDGECSGSGEPSPTHCSGPLMPSQVAAHSPSRLGRGAQPPLSPLSLDQRLEQASLFADGSPFGKQSAAAAPPHGAAASSQGAQQAAAATASGTSDGKQHQQQQQQPNEHVGVGCPELTFSGSFDAEPSVDFLLSGQGSGRPGGWLASDDGSEGAGAGGAGGSDAGVQLRLALLGSQGDGSPDGLSDSVASEAGSLSSPRGDAVTTPWADAVHTPWAPAERHARAESALLAGDVLDLSDADSDLLAPTPPTVAKPASPPPSTAQPDAPPAYMLAGSLGEGVQAAGSSERLRAAAAAATDSLPDADCEEVLRLRGGSSAVQGYCEDECSDELYDEPSEVEQDEEDRHEEGGSIGSGLQGQLAPPDAVTPSTYRLLLHTSASAGAGTKAQVTLEVVDGAGKCFQHQPPQLPRAFATGSCCQLFVEWQQLEGGCAALRVWHDGAGFAESWLPESITVQHMLSGCWWRFSNHHWVYGGGKQRARSLQPCGCGDASQLPLPPPEKAGTQGSAEQAASDAAPTRRSSAGGFPAGAPAAAAAGLVPLMQQLGLGPCKLAHMPEQEGLSCGDTIPAAPMDAAAACVSADAASPQAPAAACTAWECPSPLPLSLSNPFRSSPRACSGSGMAAAAALLQPDHHGLAVATAAEEQQHEQAEAVYVDAAAFQPAPELQPILTRVPSAPQEQPPARPESRSERAARKAGLRRTGSAVPAGCLQPPGAQLDDGADSDGDSSMNGDEAASSSAGSSSESGGSSDDAPGAPAAAAVATAAHHGGSLKGTGSFRTAPLDDVELAKQNRAASPPHAGGSHLLSPARGSPGISRGRSTASLDGSAWQQPAHVAAASLQGGASPTHALLMQAAAVAGLHEGRQLAPGRLLQRGPRGSSGAVAGVAAGRVSGSMGDVRNIPLAASESCENTPAAGSLVSSPMALGGARAPPPSSPFMGSPFAAQPQHAASGSGAGGDSEEEGSGSGVFAWRPRLSSRSPRVSAGSATYLGSRARKVVRFQQWAQQLEYEAGSSSDGGSSLASLTEEQLLEAQGEYEFTTYAGPMTGYGDLLLGGTDAIAGTASAAAAAVASSSSNISAFQAAAAVGQRGGSDGGAATLQEVPLVASKPSHKAAEYKLRLYTADKLTAGLPGGQTVHLELVNAAGAVVAHELPRPRGSFQRGCVDRFTLLSEGGDLGSIAAVRVWSEPAGGIGERSWCLDKVELENKVKGLRYRFVNVQREGWLGRGPQRAVVLASPTVTRLDDREELAQERAELLRQLETNTELNERDRQLLGERIEQIGTRLACMPDGSPLAGPQAGRGRSGPRR